MKNSLLSLLIISLSLTFLSSCSSNRFVSGNFDGKTASHKTIAVVPVKMTFTGNIPEKITPEDVITIENAESREFQTSILNSILRSTKRGRKPMTVDMQSARLTNSLLEEAGISIRESWDMNPQKLADILGVDAVVTANITKERYLSQEASYLIGTGIQIVRGMGGGLAGIPASRGVTKTYDINVDVATVDAISGETLFSNRDVIAINWTCTPEQAIEKVNRRLTRKFPYSKKD